MDKVEQKFLKAVRDFDLLREGDRVVVAFSGGGGQHSASPPS